MLLACDIIIYDVTSMPSQTEEASWAMQGKLSISLKRMVNCAMLLALHDHLDDYSTPKVFVCVSTVLTWAKSKVLDPVSTPL